MIIEIKKLETTGEINLFYYPDRPPHIPADDADLIQKSVELYELNGDIYNAIYCVQRFPHLKTQVYETVKKLFGIDLRA
jgi:hypothetical protein